MVIFAKFASPVYVTSPLRGSPLNFATGWVRKNGLIPLPEGLWWYIVHLFVRQYRHWTDRQTDRRTNRTISRNLQALACWRAKKLSPDSWVVFYNLKKLRSNAHHFWLTPFLTVIASESIRRFPVTSPHCRKLQFIAIIVNDTLPSHRQVSNYICHLIRTTF